MQKYLYLLVILLTLNACGGHSNSGTDQPGTDQPGTDQPGTDQPGTDQPGTDQPVTDPALTSAVWTGAVNETAKGLLITRSGEDAWFLLMDSTYTPQTLAVLAQDPDAEEVNATGIIYPLATGTGSAASLTGTTNQDQFTATLTSDTDTEVFTAALISNSYYAGAADQNAARGLWQADYGDEGRVIIDVAATGAFSAVRENNPNCSFGGTLSAESEPAIYAVTFDETVCGGERLEGLGLIAPVGEQQRLYLLLTTADQQAGAVFMGLRQ